MFSCIVIYYYICLLGKFLLVTSAAESSIYPIYHLPSAYKVGTWLTRKQDKMERLFFCVEVISR